MYLSKGEAQSPKEIFLDTCVTQCSKFRLDGSVMERKPIWKQCIDAVREALNFIFLFIVSFLNVSLPDNDSLTLYSQLIATLYDNSQVRSKGKRSDTFSVMHSLCEIRSSFTG